MVISTEIGSASGSGKDEADRAEPLADVVSSPWRPARVAETPDPLRDRVGGQIEIGHVPLEQHVADRATDQGKVGIGSQEYVPQGAQN